MHILAVHCALYFSLTNIVHNNGLQLEGEPYGMEVSLVIILAYLLSGSSKSKPSDVVRNSKNARPPWCGVLSCDAGHNQRVAIQLEWPRGECVVVLQFKSDVKRCQLQFTRLL